MIKEAVQEAFKEVPWGNERDIRDDLISDARDTLSLLQISGGMEAKQAIKKLKRIMKELEHEYSVRDV